MPQQEINCMSSLPLTRRRFTAEEYLMIERAADTRSELLDGEIYAMSGASEPHIRIVSNLAGEAHRQLKGTRCEGMFHDMKVATGREGLYAYPDYLIVCGETQYLDSHRDVLLNPTAIFEVLSPSTHLYDRTTKFDRYKELDSLRDYLIIAQDSPRVEHYSRSAEGWTQTVLIGLDASFSLSGVHVTIALVDLYDRIAFPAADQAHG
jgi:Uma2 family endonuclease